MSSIENVNMIISEYELDELIEGVSHLLSDAISDETKMEKEIKENKKLYHVYPDEMWETW
jgi:hypothetical protein